MSKHPTEEQGTYLAKARKQQCGFCGQVMAKAHRIHLGTGYCSICYPRVFPARTCHVCGETARSHRNDATPTCGSCLREDRSCLRCGKLTPRAALRVGQRVACATCAHYYRTPEPCDMCSAKSTRLSRSRAFPENGRMCDRCLRAAVGATCSHCRKHRTVSFMTLDKKPLCVTCCAHPHSTHPCPDCSETVNGPGASPCMTCGIKRSNIARQQGAQHLLVSHDVRKLYADFTEWCNRSGRASKLAANAARYFQFLAKLDIAVQQSSQELNRTLIVQAFTTEELRQMGLLTQHLAETGLMSDDASTRRRHSDERLLAAKLQTVANEPWAQDVQSFYESLLNREPPLALRSQKAYLHAAISLLSHAAVSRASKVTQRSLNGLLAKKPGLRASLSAFLAHLEHSQGIEITPSRKPPKPLPVIRQARYVRALLDAIESTDKGDKSKNRPARLALTAKLLSKLLNAPIDRVLRLRHSDVDFEGLRKLRLNGVWMELPEAMRPILSALPSARWTSGQDADPLIFEGRVLLDSLSSSAVDHHVQPIVGRK